MEGKANHSWEQDVGYRRKRAKQRLVVLGSKTEAKRKRARRWLVIAESRAKARRKTARQRLVILESKRTLKGREQGTGYHS